MILRRTTSKFICYSGRSGKSYAVAAIANSNKNHNTNGNANSISASEAPSDLKAKGKKIAHRQALVESYVHKYRATNAGKFPTTKNVVKEVGGSYYVIKKILQELEYQSKVSVINTGTENALEKTFIEGNGRLSEVKEVSTRKAFVNSVVQDDPQTVAAKYVEISVINDEHTEVERCPQSTSLDERTFSKEVATSDSYSESVAKGDHLKGGAEESFHASIEKLDKDEAEKDISGFVQRPGNMLQQNLEDVSHMYHGNSKNEREKEAQGQYEAAVFITKENVLSVMDTKTVPRQGLDNKEDARKEKFVSKDLQDKDISKYKEEHHEGKWEDRPAVGVDKNTNWKEQAVMEINKRDPPQELNHSFHSHTLTLDHSSYFYYCDSCHKYFSRVPSYSCRECNFDLDVKCALMGPIRCEGQEQIEHFSHQHPMPVVEIDPQHHIQCFACQSLCSGPAYACRACEYFLHKSCAHLPREIQQHPAHSFHPLFLCVWHYGSFTCKICQKEKKNTFCYGCKQCSPPEFLICVKCYHENPLSLLRPSIKYRYHEHLLYFIEEYYCHIAQCEAPDNYCHRSMSSNDPHHATNSIFLCTKCDFKIHFMCGPLPSTIKHECHMHSLILIDSVVETNFDNYYCDVCEFERNPRIRVYYCKECQYIAHPHCVISEIVKVFNGDLGGVKLKLIGEDFWEQPQEEDWDTSSYLTLRDLLSSNDLTEDEKYCLNRWFKWDKSSKGEEDSKVEVADEDIIDEIITRYPFFNQQEDLTSFFFDDFGRFLRNEKLVVKSIDLSLKIVGVQGYSIPVTLAPVLQTLLHKYPHITTSASSRYGDITRAMKSICFFFLCKVINSMHTTRFADITKNLLRDWYYYLQFLSYQDFRIDFVKRHLEMMTRAFVGIQLVRLETEIPTMINKKIVKLQQETEKEIAGLKAKVEVCNKHFESSSNPEFIKDNLRIGAELKWKTAGQVVGS